MDAFVKEKVFEDPARAEKTGRETTDPVWPLTLVSISRRHPSFSIPE
jgi:hypothetical protein